VRQEMSKLKKVNLKPANIEMKKYCPNCRDEKIFKVKEIKEIYPVRGEEIEIEATVRYCEKCNELIFDEDLDTENINKAFEKYRLLNSYLSPVDIETIRNKYGLSQRGLAILLDWSPATIARYETGAIPSPSHHSILIMIRDNIEYVKELFERKYNQLGRLDKKRMEEKLHQIEDEIFERDIVNILIKKYQRFNDHINSGFSNFDFNKFSNIVLYFTKNISKVSKTKLMKLLFYSDFKNYKEYGLSVSGIVYQHLPYGPVPCHHWLMLDALTENEIIELKPFDNYEGEYIEPITDLDLSLFSTEELDTLERVTCFFKDFSAVDISNYSHEEDAYISTEDRDLISYDFADTLRDF
jgi:putative zinc finger/helix-turn-helix YgiT family protein